jgi:hypothetical protein
MSTDAAGSPRVADVLAEAIGQLEVAMEPQSTSEYLELITVSASIEAEARSLLHEAVTSARSAGVTWSAVGGALGMSKQAAQKRFATSVGPAAADLGPDERIIGPVTAFDEMAELELAGKYGWHSVEFGPLFHRVVRSRTQWEHARVSMLTSRARAMRADGWQLIGSAFPYTYLKRDLGTRAWAEPGEGPPERPRAS